MDNSASFGMIVKKFRIGWYARAAQKPRPRALKKLFYGALSPPDTALGREEDEDAALSAARGAHGRGGERAEKALSGLGRRAYSGILKSSSNQTIRSGYS